jgi:hypothetical protein
VYLADGPSMEKHVAVVSPLALGDGLPGVLHIQYRIETVKSWMQKLRVEPAGFLYVTDQQQQLVVFPFQVLRGRPKPVGDWTPVAVDLPPDGAALVFRHPRTAERWLAGVHPVGTPGDSGARPTGWRVVAVQPEAAALRLVRRLFDLLAVVVLALVLVVGGVGLRWLQLHALTLRLLRQHAKLLHQGRQSRLRKDAG